MTRNKAFFLIFALQLACAIFFVGDILVTFLGLPFEPVNWHVHEAIEIGAAVGLVLGVLVGARILRQSLARTEKAEDQLRVASGAFAELMQERFDQWGLTPAEQDVALFSIKGLSVAEIAGLRDTSEGTVKAQTNAIYRKAGVTGRPQLLSLFIEDLLQDRLLPAA